MTSETKQTIPRDEKGWKDLDFMGKFNRAAMNVGVVSAMTALVSTVSSVGLLATHFATGSDPAGLIVTAATGALAVAFTSIATAGAGFMAHAVTTDEQQTAEIRKQNSSRGENETLNAVMPLLLLDMIT